MFLPLQFLRSMAGRIFLWLLGGLLIASILAIGFAELRRGIIMERYDREMTVTRVEDFVAALDGADEHRLPFHRNIPVTPGTRFASKVEPAQKLDGVMTAALSRRIAGRAIGIEALSAEPSVCLPLQALQDAVVLPKCWLVSFRLRDGKPVRLAVNTPLHLMMSDGSRLIDPVYLLIVFIGLVIVAFFTARVAAAPLKELSLAAQNLTNDLNHPALLEHGPHEVRVAARAFNLMQSCLRQTLIERMEMLGAITHDLQTPLTRLRLRLDKVENAGLRDRLLADLSETQALIAEGLDLARANDATREVKVTLDLDSVLSSLAADDADSGRAVTFTQGSGCDVRAGTQTLRRCIGNLVDNAIKYGGSAALSAERQGNEVVVHVIDCGPGLPDDMLERVLQPFFRRESSRSRDTGGTGLGLTIAKTFAEHCSGRLTLRNCPGGGLDAMVTLPVEKQRAVLWAPIDPEQLIDA